MTFFKGFVTCSIVSLHGLVAFVAYEQRAKTVWLNKKINALYRTHRMGHRVKRGQKVLKCYKKPPLLKKTFSARPPIGLGVTKASPCHPLPKNKSQSRVNL